MMIKNKYPEKENNVFPKEIDDMIFSTRPEWTRSKEDIWKEMEAKLDALPVKTRIQPIQSFQLLKYAAIACVALLISFGSAASLYTKTVKTASVEKGFLLPDNSKVMLHANSSLSYKPLLWKFSRSTKLDGEAYFEVEKGSTFEVISEKAKTVVLGTHFLITARANDYQVYCYQGKVMIIESAKKNEVVITAGQEAKLKTNKQFEVIPQHQNHSKGMSSGTNQSVKENDFAVSEEKPNVNPKDEMSVVPSKQRSRFQEKILSQKPNQTNVKPNAQNGAMANHMTESKNLKVESKPQIGNQEHVNLQKQDEETSGTSAESSKSRFRNSLTQKQISILEDNTMDRAERQKAFMKSLTGEQRQLLKEQNAEMQQGNGVAKNSNPKNAMKDNMKADQKGNKKQLPNNAIDKGGNGLQRGGGKPSSK